MSNFHLLTVKEVIQETTDCVTIVFDIPDELQRSFHYKPGQYLTISHNINGEEVRRAYSISSAPADPDLGISVKRVAGGKMSTFLTQDVKKGDRLEVMQPDGKFTLISDVQAMRDHYFFAAGSGITPIMSMIKTILEYEPQSTAYLLYGNRDEENIIFKSELDELQKKYRDQLEVIHTLTQPRTEKSSGILGMLGKQKSNWRGLRGRVDSAKVAELVQNNPPKSGKGEYYICGPGSMIDDVATTLMGNEVKEENIHREYFTAGDAEVKTVESASNAVLHAVVDGQEVQLVVKDAKTILDTLLDAGIDAPYSCTSGACSSCMGKVVEGSAEMKTCFALDDEEIAEGYILTCQAHPTSDRIKVIIE